MPGTMIPNYPAFSLMLFEGAVWGYSLFADTLEPPPGARGNISEAGRIWIKLPAVFFDLLATFVIFVILRKLTDDQKALIGAGIFALHPVAWFDSSIWGQTDVIFTLFSLLAMLLMGMRRFMLGGAIAALALFTKFQTVMFFPLFLLLCIRTIWGVPKAILGAACMIFFITLPFLFGGTVDDALFVFVRSVQQGQGVSVNAYNFWWALMTDSSRGVKDSEWMFGLLPYRTVGIIIVGILYLRVLVRLWHILRESRTYEQIIEPIIATSMLCSGAFFLFITQMHERYMYSFFLLGIIPAILRPTLRVPYAIMSLAYFFNLVGVVQFTPIDKALFAEFESFDGFVASVLVLSFIWIWVRTFKTSLAIPPHRLGHDFRTWMHTAWHSVRSFRHHS